MACNHLGNHKESNTKICNRKLYSSKTFQCKRFNIKRGSHGESEGSAPCGVKTNSITQDTSSPIVSLNPQRWAEGIETHNFTISTKDTGKLIVKR